MSESKKFTQEEISQIQTLREANGVKVTEFGNIELEILLTKQKLDALHDIKEKSIEDYKKLQDQEKELVQVLNNKYGAGTVDLESGEFIPSK